MKTQDLSQKCWGHVFLSKQKKVQQDLKRRSVRSPSAMESTRSCWLTHLFRWTSRASETLCTIAGTSASRAYWKIGRKRSSFPMGTKIRILDTQKEVSRNIIPKRKNLARLWALRGDDAKHGGVSDVCKRIFGFGFME